MENTTAAPDTLQEILNTNIFLWLYAGPLFEFLTFYLT